jgi:hypothetical protein
MSTEQLTPEQTRIKDKLAHLSPQDRKKALDLIKQMAPKHNMQVLKRQADLFNESGTADLPTIPTKQPSPEAIEIAAKMMANRAVRQRREEREAKEAVPDDEE